MKNSARMAFSSDRRQTMCFSLEASLGAAALLTVVGYATVRSTSSKKELFLALIPLIFALQQYAEALVWYTLQNELENSLIHQIGKNLFLFISYILWPIWVPLSLYILEEGEPKKRLLFYFTLAGGALALFNLLSLPGNEPYAKIRHNSIEYGGATPSQLAFILLRAAYASIVLLPTLISGFKHIWQFGALLAISYIISEALYFQTFTSVWCFFAALCSLVLYKVIRDNRPA